jgi:hypothetical protein
LIGQAKIAFSTAAIGLYYHYQSENKTIRKTR